MDRIAKTFKSMSERKSFAKDLLILCIFFVNYMRNINKFIISKSEIVTI